MHKIGESKSMENDTFRVSSSGDFMKTKSSDINGRQNTEIDAPTSVEDYTDNFSGSVGCSKLKKCNDICESQNADIDVFASMERLHATIEEEANITTKKLLPLKILALNTLCNEFSKRVEMVRESQKSIVPNVAEAYLKVNNLSSDAASELDRQDDVSGGFSKKTKVAYSNSDIKDMVLPHNVPMNEGIFLILKDLTNEVISAMELLRKVKTWIPLRIPKIETGNNFGVEVLEECLAELYRVETAGFAVLESTSDYHRRRARLSYKCAKHPLISDYRQAILECDDIECDLIKLRIIDLRNNLFILHDFLGKNYDKILKPRNENTSVMIY